MISIPLVLSATNDEAATQLMPVTAGVPCPRGAVFDETTLALRTASGGLGHVQSRILDRWADGSARWLQCSFEARATAWGPCLHLVTGPSPPADAPLAVSVDAAAVRVRTGRASFQLAAGGTFPFGEIDGDGDALLGAGRLEMRMPGHAVCQFRIADVRAIEAGPLRATIRIAAVPSPGGPAVEARLDFFAGSAVVHCALTVRNDQAASHPGGYWQLGDPASMRIEDLSIVMPVTANASEVYCSPSPGGALSRMGSPFELYQDSSGGANWRSPVHVAADGRVPTTFQGYRLVSAGEERRGDRATPLVEVRCGERRAGLVMRQFWQNFPKALEFAAGALTLRLFPSQWSGVHELQPGEQKTHAFAVDFGGEGPDRYALTALRSPARVTLDPHWVAGTSAVPGVSPATGSAYDTLVSAAVEGSDTFFGKREVIDEFGWRNFGDLYADHEAIGHAGPAPLVSHYNNQYDVIAGCAVQFLRTGDPRWHELLDDLAHHVRDIDIYHTDGDKAAYNGGLFWHTCHYVDAGTSTHRSYPAAPGVCGGGPGAEHNYTTGLMLHYFLTGEDASRDAAIGLARWVLQMEDGRRTVFRWLSRGATGLASAAGSATYHGPGRGGANSLNALIDGHRLTGDPVFLRTAEALIRRCIHPEDDVEGRQLLDAERRWSYTVFLQAVGRYLGYKLERHEPDAMYAYAARSLLHYARWMARHEYPYLDKPEILEYPNETWAAQDIRKSEVFDYAARHASGEERAQFLERAAFFHAYAVTTLQGMPTRTLTRPVALLLSNGYVRAAGQALTPAHVPAAVDAVSQPEVFVPQKQIAVRRAAALAVAAGLTLVAGVAYLLV